MFHGYVNVYQRVDRRKFRVVEEPFKTLARWIASKQAEEQFLMTCSEMADGTDIALVVCKQF